MSPADKNGRQRKVVKKYMQYTGMAFQLLGLIVMAVLAGKWLDNRMQTEKPYFTAGLVVFFLVTYLIKVYYDVSRIDSE